MELQEAKKHVLKLREFYLDINYVNFKLTLYGTNKPNPYREDIKLILEVENGGNAELFAYISDKPVEELTNADIREIIKDLAIEAEFFMVEGNYDKLKKVFTEEQIYRLRK